MGENEETEVEPTPETEEEPEENFTRSGGRRASNLGRNREVASKELPSGNKLAESKLTEAPTEEDEEFKKLCAEIEFQADENDFTLTKEDIKGIAKKMIADKFFFNHDIFADEDDEEAWGEINDLIVSAIEAYPNKVEESKLTEDEDLSYIDSDTNNCKVYYAVNTSGYKSLGLIVNDKDKKFQVVAGQKLRSGSKTAKKSKKQIWDMAKELKDNGYEEVRGPSSVAGSVYENKEIKTEVKETYEYALEVRDKNTKKFLYQVDCFNTPEEAEKESKKLILNDNEESFITIITYDENGNEIESAIYKENKGIKTEKKIVIDNLGETYTIDTDAKTYTIKTAKGEKTFTFDQMNEFVKAYRGANRMYKPMSVLAYTDYKNGNINKWNIKKAVEESVSQKEYDDIVSAIDNATSIEELQDIVLAVSDGTVEDEMQSMLDACIKDNDDLDTVKSLLSNIFEDNADIEE